MNDNDKTQEVISIAKSYVGELEKTFDPYTQYDRGVNQRAGNNRGFVSSTFENKLKLLGWKPNIKLEFGDTDGQWCNIFVALVYKEAFERPFACLLKNCKNILNFSKDIFVWNTEKPVPGAIYLCNGHCGIVIEFDEKANRIVTIEGNTTPDSSKDDGVYKFTSTYTDFIKKCNNPNSNSRKELIGYIYPILKPEPEEYVPFDSEIPGEQPTGVPTFYKAKDPYDSAEQKKEIKSMLEAFSGYPWNVGNTDILGDKPITKRDSYRKSKGKIPIDRQYFPYNKG